MTNTTHIENDSRRRFLQGTAGLTLSVYLPTTLSATDAAGTGKAVEAGRTEGRLGHTAHAWCNGDKRGRGVAVHESFSSYVAQVAEVTVKPDGSVKVDHIVCAVDCGIAINPDNIRSQVEGSVGFALSAALHGAITLKDGVVASTVANAIAAATGKRVRRLPIMADSLK